MNHLTNTAVLLGLAVGLSACSTTKIHPIVCITAGALAGGGAAYVGSDHKRDVTAVSAAGGALLGALLCKEPEAPTPVAVEPTPPPEPTPEPPPPPPPAAPEAGATLVSLEGTHFDFDKATLRPAATAKLDHAAEVMTEHAGVKLSVEGHTDSVGSDAYNQDLSERRAQSVVEYLVGKGIDASRLMPAGYGEGRPIASNDTAEGRAQNRRVDLVVSE